MGSRAVLIFQSTHVLAIEDDELHANLLNVVSHTLVFHEKNVDQR